MEGYMDVPQNVPQNFGVPYQGVSWAQQSETIIKELLDTDALLLRIKERLMNVTWDKDKKKYEPVMIFDAKKGKNIPLPPLINFKGLSNVLLMIETACDKFISLSNFTDVEVARKAEENAVRLTIDIGLNMREWEIEPCNYDVIVDSLDELYHAALKKALDAITLKGVTSNINVNVQKIEGDESQKASYWRPKGV